MVQKTRESTPRMLAWVTGMPWAPLKHSRMA